MYVFMLFLSPVLLVFLYLATDSEDTKKENPQGTTIQMTSETTQRSQRQSLIGLLTGELHHQKSSTHEQLQHLKGMSKKFLQIKQVLLGISGNSNGRHSPYKAD